MANQPTHEWNTSVFHEVEKFAKDNITLARTVTKNSNSVNPQVLSLESPVATVAALSTLTCTLLDILEDQGVTPNMVARLMGKMAGGRDHAIHRLLPLVKKEIKLETKESKCLTIPRLDQKESDIAAGKRHPKAKGQGRGPKSSRETATVVTLLEDKVPEDAENEKCVKAGLEAAGSKKRRIIDSTDRLLEDNDREQSEGLIESDRDDDDDDHEGKADAPISSQAIATAADGEEIVARKEVNKEECTEHVCGTGESMKRKRAKSDNRVLEVDDENEENGGTVAED